MKIRTVFDKLSHDPAKSIAVMLIVITGLLFLQQIMSGISGSVIVEEVPSVAAPLKQPLVGEAQEDQALQAPLFGRLALDPAIKPSTLQLEVVGVLYSSTSTRSQVIIKAANGQESVYNIGDTLPGGAIIKEIKQHGLVVFHNGALERLMIKKDPLHFAPIPQPLFKDS